MEQQTKHVLITIGCICLTMFIIVGFGVAWIDYSQHQELTGPNEMATVQQLQKRYRETRTIGHFNRKEMLEIMNDFWDQVKDGNCVLVWRPLDCTDEQWEQWKSGLIGYEK